MECVGSEILAPAQQRFAEFLSSWPSLAILDTLGEELVMARKSGVEQARPGPGHFNQRSAHGVGP